MNDFDLELDWVGEEVSRWNTEQKCQYLVQLVDFI